MGYHSVHTLLGVDVDIGDDVGGSFHVEIGVENVDFFE